jgi:hypothetical protein
MDLDRRRSPRLPFAGVAELSTAEPAKYNIAAATQIGRFGCFIKTTVGFTSGREVNVRITSEGDEFTAPGRVVYALPRIGIGIAFGAVSPKDQALLERWLSEPGQEDFKRISVREAVRIRMAFLDDFPVQLTCPECQRQSLAKISALKDEKAYTFPCGHSFGAERFGEDIAGAERE